MNWLDLKLGGRMLVKYPGLTIVGGLAIAFTIWVGIVIFQVVGLFVHPTLPLPEGARLVEVRSMDVAANVQEKKVLHDFLEWRQSLRSLTDVGAWRDSSRNLIVAAARSNAALRPCDYRLCPARGGRNHDNSAGGVDDVRRARRNGVTRHASASRAPRQALRDDGRA